MAERRHPDRNRNRDGNPRRPMGGAGSRPAPGARPPAGAARGGPGPVSRPRPSPASKRRSGGAIPPEFADAARGERLQRVLADAGVASRRDAEALIAQGRVTVNGKVVSALPAWVNPQEDRIEVNGQPIRRPKRQANPRGRREAATPGGAGDRVYVALNKPRRVISTARDPEGRANVVDLVDLPPDLPQRLFPVGRLDADSTGLILPTNDGELANRLTHPRYQVPKQYVVLIRGRLTPEDIDRLKAGVYLANRRAGAPPAASSRDEPSGRAKRATIEDVRMLGVDRDVERGDRTRVLMTLREGQNREIRRVLARLGFQVRRLERIAIGPLTSKGIGRGQWRFLTPTEVRALYHAAGI